MTSFIDNPVTLFWIIFDPLPPNSHAFYYKGFYTAVTKSLVPFP